MNIVNQSLVKQLKDKCPEGFKKIIGEYRDKPLFMFKHNGLKYQDIVIETYPDIYIFTLCVEEGRKTPLVIKEGNVISWQK